MFAPVHKYEGDMYDFIPSGFGKMTFPDVSVYEGEFSNGKMAGYGTMRLAKGVVN